jgi:putative ABC transport system permease protein
MSFVITRLRTSARRLTRRPGASVPAMAAIALAGAAVVLMLAFVDGLMLKPLPYPEPERLQYLAWRSAPQESFPRAMTERQARHFIENATAFEAIGAYADAGTQFTLDGRGDGAIAERVAGVRIDSGVLPTLGVLPREGRNFSADEAVARAHRVIISAQLAAQRFSGASAIGRSVRIDGIAHEVVGVMPATFRFHPDVEVMVPSQPGGIGAGGSNTTVLGRLLPGVDVAAAQSELSALSAGFGEDGGDRGPFGTAEAVALSYADVVVGNTGGMLLPVGGAVALLALLACLNASTLLLGMSLASRGDAAVELALGARRAMLIGSRMVEAALVVIAGCGLALLLSLLLLPMLKAAVPIDLPRMADVAIDGRVLRLAALAAVGMLAVCAGLAAFGARIGRLAEAVRTQSAARGGGHVGVQPWLVAGQVGLSCVLLVGCALMIGSFTRLVGEDGGFRIDGVQTVQLALADARYRDAAEATARSVALLRELEARLAVTPGVRAVTSTSSLPLQTGLNNWIERSGTATGASVEVRAIGAEYFRLLQVPIVAGRGIEGEPQSGQAPTVIINVQLARQFFGEPAAAVGATLAMDGIEWTISGVSADMREASLRNPALPTVYVPRAQMTPGVQAAVNRWFTTALLIDAGELATGDLVRNALRAIDPDVAVVAARPLSVVVGASLALERFFGGALAVFGLLSLTLTAIGLFGVLGQLQWLRRHEFAVRLAIGASGARNARLLMTQALRWTAIGLAIGVPLAWLARSALSPWLYASGIIRDLPWLAAAVAALAMAMALATIGPMRRAGSIAPAQALRAD